MLQACNCILTYIVIVVVWAIGKCGTLPAILWHIHFVPQLPPAAAAAAAPQNCQPVKCKSLQIRGRQFPIFFPWTSSWKFTNFACCQYSICLYMYVCVYCNGVQFCWRWGYTSTFSWSVVWWQAANGRCQHVCNSASCCLIGSVANSTTWRVAVAASCTVAGLLMLQNMLERWQWQARSAVFNLWA